MKIYMLKNKQNFNEKIKYKFRLYNNIVFYISTLSINFTK